MGDIMDNNKKILKTLKIMYPDAKPQLNFTSPFELLIATMLSAQSTDEQVNKVTKGLFEVVKSPEDIVNMPLKELEEHVKGCGIYRNKARNIKKTCEILVTEHNSQVPRHLEELVELPGVGRKTANVVLSNAFDIPAIGVDTHVFRVSARLGLTVNAKNPFATELQLQKIIPESDWKQAHHWLIYHGRRVCAARKPKCPDCQLNKWCQDYIGKIDFSTVKK
jgi:endonuclease-3